MGLFATGSIISATPSTALMTVIDTNMLAVGWVFVETYTSGTDITNVYKSPGSLNSWGIDFYVGVRRASTTGTIYVMLGELYDIATHKFTKYAYAGLSSLPDTDGTVIDAVGLLPTAMSSASNVAINCFTSISFDYYLNCSIDRIILGTSAVVSSSAGVNPVYIGLYDPVYSFDKFPICVMTLGQGNNSAGVFYGSATREFSNAALTGNWSVQLPSTAGTYLYPTGAYGATLDYYTINSVASRMTIASTLNPSFAIRGLLKDVVVLNAGFNSGDIIQVTQNSITYTYIRMHQASSGSGNIINTVWCPTF